MKRHFTVREQRKEVSRQDSKDRKEWSGKLGLRQEKPLTVIILCKPKLSLRT